jgi:hypothetical protein
MPEQNMAAPKVHLDADQQGHLISVLNGRLTKKRYDLVAARRTPFTDWFEDELEDLCFDYTLLGHLIDNQLTAESLTILEAYEVEAKLAKQ